MNEETLEREETLGQQEIRLKKRVNSEVEKILDKALAFIKKASEEVGPPPAKLLGPETPEEALGTTRKFNTFVRGTLDGAEQRLSFLKQVKDCICEDKK